jgi:hypothetical protein
MVLTALYEALRTHVFAAAPIHGDDTPVLAPGKTGTARLWIYVRDNRPFAGSAPPAAVFFYSPDRLGEHAERQLAAFDGTLRADADAGFNELYDGARWPRPVTERPAGLIAGGSVFRLANPALRKKKLLSPIALEAVKRIDTVFASSVRSTVDPHQRVSPCVDSASCRWSTSSKPGCGSSVPGCPAMPSSPRPSITC